MTTRLLKYGLKLNDYRTATYVTGPDGKVIADTGIARICKSADLANAVTSDNIAMAKRIRACLNACDGMSIEALEALPTSFNTLLSDSFMNVLQQTQITAMVSDEESRKFIEAWHASPQRNMIVSVQPSQSFELMPPIEVEQIAWLQKAHTLHRQVSMLYVVDGYEVTVEWDENPISEAFHGETLREAISKAMAGHDLDVRHPYQDRVKLYPEDAQRALLLSTLKDLRARIEKMSLDHWWIDTPDRGGFDADALDAVLAEFEGSTV